MKILVINAGSSSIKYQLMDIADVHHCTLLASGLVEKIGEPVGRVIHKTFAGGQEQKTVEEGKLPTHREGMARVVALLTDPQKGVIRDAAEIHGVGHRVVLCGEIYKNTVRVTPKVKETIREFFPLSPLHNPANLMGIEVAEEFFPKAPQVAVLDTAFHQTMPPKAYLYAVPTEWYTKHRLRRYGFHGTSHKFIAQETAEFIGKPLDRTSLISIHLGNGCSMTAIRNGRSIDTTMGVTPLEGLMMGTRSGDIDAAALEYIMGQTGLDIHQITAALNKQSGLKGVCGVNDMREVVEAAAAGNAQAETALEMFCYRIQKYIGAYMAVVPNLDAVVFTAGIGQNSAPVRERICRDLAHLGLRIDPAKNAARSDAPRAIQQDGAPLKILVLPTNEELQIALETKQIIEGR
jgi:acetate kinase